MEFERAIFRVYERCIEGLREDDNETVNAKSCRVIELMTIVGALFFLFSLTFLHVTFVGQSGCLPELLLERNQSILKPDQILRITVDRKFAPGVDNSGSSDSHSNIAISDERRLLKIRRLISNQNVIFGSPWLSDLLTTPANFTSSNSTKALSNSSHSYFDYEFAFDVGLLALSDEIREKHNFEIVNVTMSEARCFGDTFTRSFLPLGGIDTVIVNYVMKTVNKGGIVVSKTGDYYAWQDKDIHPYDTFLEWLAFKVSVVAFSLLSFFLLSTSTALLVRVLISSGVVLLFPLFWIMQKLCGLHVISAHIIRLSYPWIGVPIEMLRARNQSAVPFLIAHTTRVVLYYVFYEACQLAFSQWIYGQARPGQRELWLFAIMMLWEYFSMIYVRSLFSIQLFPRASLAIFLLYHFYLYSQPFGFHLLALLVMFLFLTALQIFCVRKYEYEAYFRGDVNIDQPRILYNTTGWPAWPVALAPDFTLFLPLTERAVNVYQNVVPPVHAAEEAVGELDSELAGGADESGNVDGGRNSHIGDSTTGGAAAYGRGDLGATMAARAAIAAAGATVSGVSSIEMSGGASAVNGGRKSQEITSTGWNMLHSPSSSSSRRSRRKAADIESGTASGVGDDEDDEDREEGDGGVGGVGGASQRSVGVAGGAVARGGSGPGNASSARSSGGSFFSASTGLAGGGGLGMTLSARSRHNVGVRGAYSRLVSYHGAGDECTAEVDGSRSSGAGSDSGGHPSVERDSEV